MFYAYGFNQYNVYGIKSIHAEVDALNKLKSNKKKKPKKVNIIIFRINNAGTKLLMAKPCFNCQQSIIEILKYKNYKLKKCWFTTNEGYFEQFKF